jgi:hypothetical protein
MSRRRPTPLRSVRRDGWLARSSRGTSAASSAATTSCARAVTRTSRTTPPPACSRPRWISAAGSRRCGLGWRTRRPRRCAAHRRRRVPERRAARAAGCGATCARSPTRVRRACNARATRVRRACDALSPSVWSGFLRRLRVGALCRACFAGRASIPAGFAAATFPNRDSRLRFGLDLVGRCFVGAGGMGGVPERSHRGEPSPPW